METGGRYVSVIHHIPSVGVIKHFVLGGLSGSSSSYGRHPFTPLRPVGTIRISCVTMQVEPISNPSVCAPRNLTLRTVKPPSLSFQLMALFRDKNTWKPAGIFGDGSSRTESTCRPDKVFYGGRHGTSHQITLPNAC